MQWEDKGDERIGIKANSNKIKTLMWSKTDTTPLKNALWRRAKLYGTHQ